MTRWAATALLLALAACDIGFTEPRRRTQAVFWIEVVLSDSLGEARVRGVLLPGLGSTGSPRAVPDDTLRVLGRALPPAEVAADGRRLYDRGLDGADLPSSARLAAPAIPGLAAPAVVELPLTRRAGPDTLVVARDAPVELRLDGVESGEYVRWSLEISEGPASLPLAHLAVESPPPAVIVVPRAWLSGSSATELHARLSVHRRSQAGAAGDEYRSTLNVNSRLRWVLRVPPE